MSEFTVASASVVRPFDGFWRRLAHTPCSDLVRGRLTGRLDLSRAIAEEGLPPAAAALVHDVARRTRLWRIERVDVARELAAHFRDGLEAGAAAEKLVQDFGDRRQAARLIRRAKLRARPWPWRAWRWALRAAGTAAALSIAAYLVLAVRFLVGRPLVTRDYVAEMNAVSQAVPADDRAWPHYRQALLALHTPAGSAEWWSNPIVVPGPNDPAWQAVAAFVESNPEALALTREGAARPTLGFIFGDPADRDFLMKFVQRESILPAKDDFLFNTLLPHQNELRRLAWLLLADSRQAQVAGDGPRLVMDIRCLLSLADHQRTGHTLIEELIGLGDFGLVLDVTADSVRHHGDLFSDADLAGLAHELSAFAGGGTLRPRVQGERWILEDVLQRIYTDDGHGDGYVTSEGLQKLSLLSGGLGHDVPWLRRTVGPGLTVAIAGRREMRDLAMRLTDRTTTERAGPLYTWQPSTASAEMEALSQSISTRLRYLPALLLLPAVESVAMAGEQMTQRRDAVLAAIALEAYRRRHGEWPQRLEDLVPALLPELPLDRYTGGPLRYRLVDGQPQLYACGMDRADDGGRPPPGNPNTWFWAIATPPVTPPLPGQGYDLVLWPRPIPPLTTD